MDWHEFCVDAAAIAHLGATRGLEFTKLPFRNCAGEFKKKVLWFKCVLLLLL